MGKKILHFSDGEKIITQGDADSRMYVIVKGMVKIVLSENLKFVTLTELGKNDFFGEMSLFNQSKRSADAIAQGKVTLTYMDSVDELDQFLEKNPHFARKMVKTLTQRLANTNELLQAELSGRSKAAMVGFLWR